MRSIVFISFLIASSLTFSFRAGAQSCTDLTPGTSGGLAFIPCIVQEAKEINQLKNRLDQQERDLSKLRAENLLQARVVTELRTFVLRSLPTKLDAIADRLFGDVDSVYTIGADYSLEAKEISPTLIYVYADPTKHKVSAVISTRGVVPSGNEFLPFNFDVYVNKRRVFHNTTKVDGDITDNIKLPLQGSGGGGRDDNEDVDLAMAYPPYINLIEIRPHIPTETQRGITVDASKKNLTIEPSKKIKMVSIQGYVLVKRAKPLEPVNDPN